MVIRPVYLRNFRRGLATNSSSTHSLIYRNDGEVFNDLDVMELDYYDRCTNTIAASREAKIKYVLACIFYEEELTEIMSAFYPEMKQYYPLIKQQMESDDRRDWCNNDIFGMYFRDDVTFAKNTDATVEYLRHIIDNEDIIFVGGSDEMDWVYDTIDNHELVAMPHMVGHYGRNINGVNKNGNYWVGFGDYHREEPVRYSGSGKIRFATTNGDLVPEYPELIDLKITNKCDNNCPMCFMSSNMKGKHADLKFLYKIVGQCRTRTEFSIGGGSVILYPELDKLVEYMKERGHIVNVTIKASDCSKVLNDEKLKEVFDKYIDGIGISTFTVEDAKEVLEFRKAFGNKESYLGCNDDKKYVVAHLIPEYLGVEKTRKIMEALKKEYVPVLFLGYKSMGRGEKQNYTTFTKEDIITLTKDLYSLSIDTTFANRYKDIINENFSYRYTVTMNEGEFSMFIDGITENAYKSSYQTEKPYNMSYVPYGEREENPTYELKDAFAIIRKDNGFKTYKEAKKKYYDE